LKPGEEWALLAHGVSEHPMVAVAPTILNALYDATGHEFSRVPVLPKDILEVSAVT